MWKKNRVTRFEFKQYKHRRLEWSETFPFFLFHPNNKDDINTGRERWNVLWSFCFFRLVFIVVLACMSLYIPFTLVWHIVNIRVSLIDALTEFHTQTSSSKLTPRCRLNDENFHSDIEKYAKYFANRTFSHRLHLDFQTLKAQQSSTADQQFVILLNLQ